MIPAESLHVWRLVKGACPHQAMDEMTPDIWHGLLDDLRLVDCVAAVKALGRSQRYIAPADIRAEVRRIRSKRIADRAHELVPPAGLSDAEEREWLGQARRVIGDGDPLPPDGRELKPRNLPDLRELLPACDDRPRADPPTEPRRVQEHPSHGATHCADLSTTAGIEVRRYTEEDE